MAKARTRGPKPVIVADYEPPAAAHPLGVTIRITPNTDATFRLEATLDGSEVYLADRVSPGQVFFHCQRLLVHVVETLLRKYVKAFFGGNLP